jgi:hypothetical protein
MTIAVPTAGGPILDTWGAAVATLLNRIQVLGVPADQSSDSSSGVAMNGCTIDVESGKSYVGRIFGEYVVSSTAKGLRLGFDNTHGQGRIHGWIAGAGSATGETVISSAGGQQGRTSTDAATPALREFAIDFWFQATSDGTAAIEFSRGGSSGGAGVTIQKGSGGVVWEVAS